ncbi:MAG: 4Fe-4S dicluster domain-containing protein [Candidatus Lokiarchaeota archaeon]|nr:4Fe-4S dicluster domain-containing protein [Candidatus Lokiarchaeota archaeon]
MNIPIIYFSSSNNTKYICEIVSRGLSSLGYSVQLIPIQKIDNYPSIIEESDCFGVGSPIYAMNFTPNIREWMIKVAKKKNDSLAEKGFFLIDTNAGLPGGAISKAKQILTKRGLNFLGGLEITVPTFDSVFWVDYFKYVSWDKNKIKRAYYFGKRIGNILKENKNIDNKEIVKEYRNMPLSGLLSHILGYIEPLFYKFITKVMVHDFKKCNKCGICENLCPTNAINIDENIFFDPEKCIFCFLCLRKCPKEANYLKIYPNAEFFKDPSQIKGYIDPSEINFDLKESK